MRPRSKLLLFVAVFIPVFLLACTLAVYLMTSPQSVPVAVNPPSGFDVGPGWNL